MDLLTVNDDVDQHRCVRFCVLPDSICVFLRVCDSLSICVCLCVFRCLFVCLFSSMAQLPICAAGICLSINAFSPSINPVDPFRVFSVPQPMSWPRAADAFVTMQFSLIVQLLITKAIAPRAPNKDASFQAKLPTSGAFEDTSASFFDVRL